MIGKFIEKKQGREADEMLQDYSGTERASIASCIKWLSAALVKNFVDEGKLNIEHSIGTF